MNYEHNIRTRIKKELRQDCITQRELAKKLRITEVSMSRYLNGQRGLSLSMAIKLADYYKLSLDELVGRNNYE